MLTDKNLIRTFEIFAAHDGGLDNECTEMWAEHDEHGIWASHLETPLTLEEVKELVSMGWLLGCDAMYDGDERELNELSDEELWEKWEDTNGIYTYE